METETLFVTMTFPLNMCLSILIREESRAVAARASWPDRE